MGLVLRYNFKPSPYIPWKQHAPETFIWRFFTVYLFLWVASK